MSEQEQIQFKKDYKAICHQKEMILRTNDYLRRLHVYNKNDSHKANILKVLKKKKEQQTELQKLLKGKSFEYWRSFNVELRILNRKLDMVMERKHKVDKEILILKF